METIHFQYIFSCSLILFYWLIYGFFIVVFYTIIHHKLEDYVIYTLLYKLIGDLILLWLFAHIRISIKRFKLLQDLCVQHCCKNQPHPSMFTKSSFNENILIHV